MAQLGSRLHWLSLSRSWEFRLAVPTVFPATLVHILPFVHSHFSPTGRCSFSNRIFTSFRLHNGAIVLVSPFLLIRCLPVDTHIVRDTLYLVCSPIYSHTPTRAAHLLFKLALYPTIITLSVLSYDLHDRSRGLVSPVEDGRREEGRGAQIMTGQPRRPIAYRLFLAISFCVFCVFASFASHASKQPWQEEERHGMQDPAVNASLPLLIPPPPPPSHLHRSPILPPRLPGALTAL